MRTAWFNMLLFGFMVLAINATWTVYNRYVPDLLQHLGAGVAVVGFVLILDSILALVLEPTSGAFSDSFLIPRFGKRIAIVAIAAPIAAVAFAILPLFLAAIPQSGDGGIASLRQSYTPVLGVTVLMLVAMALFRSPIFGMLGDVFPKATRGQAAGVANGLGAAGTLIALHLSDRLATMHPAAPFWVASGSLIIGAIALTAFSRWGIEERQSPDTGSRQTEGKPVLWLVFFVAALVWFLGFFAFQQLLPEHAETVAGIEGEFVTQLPLLIFAIVCVPAAFAGDRIGRTRAIIAGLMCTGLLLLITPALSIPPLFTVIAGAAGVGWALVNANAIPYLLDRAPTGRRGLLVGLYFSVFAASALLGPRVVSSAQGILAGDRVFLIVPLSFILSGVLCLLLAREHEHPYVTTATVTDGSA